MKTRHKILLRNFLIELILYALLLIIYFWGVLRFLGEPLNKIFHLSPFVYAVATLILIVAQGVFLEWVTSFLITRLGLEKME
jgi:hypothetical protein